MIFHYSSRVTRRNGTRVLLYSNLSIEYQKVLRVNFITPRHNQALNFEFASQSDSKVPLVESNLFLETNSFNYLSDQESQGLTKIV